MTPEAAAHELAVRLRAVAERLRDVGAPPPSDGWEGAAAEAYAVAAASLRHRADAVAAVLDELGGRLATSPGVEQDLVHARLRLEVEADLAGPPGTDRARTAAAVRDALGRIGAAEDPVTRRPVEGHLLGYEPAAFGGDGRVVVAAGDPATAADVALLVPGLGTDGSDADVLGHRALDLHLAARQADPGDDVATVAWIGYDAPDGVGALSERMAEAGGVRLSAAVADLREARTEDPAHLTVVGHSYGATTVSLAATGPGGLDADDVVLLGSPGAGDADSAADLGTAPGHVWVLRHSLDPVAALGTAGPLGLGEDPALDTWGATRLRAESAPRARWDGWPLSGHSSYFVPSGEGLTNLALVVSGQGAGATRAPHVRDPWWAPPLDPELGRLPG